MFINHFTPIKIANIKNNPTTMGMAIQLFELPLSEDYNEKELSDD
jgi:hypothetical protein